MIGGSKYVIGGSKCVKARWSKMSRFSFSLPIYLYTQDAKNAKINMLPSPLPNRDHKISFSKETTIFACSAQQRTTRHRLRNNYFIIYFSQICFRGVGWSEGHVQSQSMKSYIFEKNISKLKIRNLGPCVHPRAKVASQSPYMYSIQSF